MVILGLGSNIGDRLGYLSAAVRSLSAVIGDMRLSRIVESPAMLPQGAPEDSDHPFLNMAISGTTSLTPQALLVEIKSIELELGRIKRHVWGPREIDIDILAMDDQVLESPELAIPHRGLVQRDFVMLPLADVAPDWRYPGKGTYHNMLASEIIAAKGFSFGDTLRDTGFKIND